MKFLGSQIKFLESLKPGTFALCACVSCLAGFMFAFITAPTTPTAPLVAPLPIQMAVPKVPEDEPQVPKVPEDEPQVPQAELQDEPQDEPQDESLEAQEAQEAQEAEELHTPEQHYRPRGLFRRWRR